MTKALVLSGGASHGAFQAGVYKALEELDWKPDIVCGSSVGAINGTSIAAGRPSSHLIDLWNNVSNKDVYSFRPWREWLTLWKWNHVLDTKPLEKFLESHINLPELYESDTLFACFGVDVKSGGLRIFTNDVGKRVSPLRQRLGPVEIVDIQSVLSSAAIPGVFPWVNGIWDGSIRQYTPLKPAVLLGATEVVIVCMDTSSYQDRLPTGIADTALRIVTLASSSRLLWDVRLMKERNKLEGYRTIKPHLISPKTPLSYSRLNFDADGKQDAIDHGYEVTMEVMGDKDE